MKVRITEADTGTNIPVGTVVDIDQHGHFDWNDDRGPNRFGLTEQWYEVVEEEPPMTQEAPETPDPLTRIATALEGILDLLKTSSYDGQLWITVALEGR